jgi:hypothetical protein
MSNRRKLPLILFGDVEDMINDWVPGSLTVSKNVTDPLGNANSAYTVNNTSGAAALSHQSPSVTVTPNVDGEVIAQIFLKVGTETPGPVHIGIRNVTLASWSHLINVTWTAGVPALTTNTGTGTLFTPVAVGSGWYLIRWSAGTDVNSSDSYKMYIYPSGTDADTGSVLAWSRSAILFGDPIDNVRAWGDPREGSDWAMTPGGVEDAWITGTDRLLAGDVRWITGLDANAPFNMTGWDGRREDAFINVGWESFLEFAWTKQTFTFVPDLTDADADPRSAYIQAPLDDNEPDLEQADMTRTFEFRIRDANDLPFKGY